MMVSGPVGFRGHSSHSGNRPGEGGADRAWGKGTGSRQGAASERGERAGESSAGQFRKVELLEPGGPEATRRWRTLGATSVPHTDVLLPLAHS